MKMMLAGAEGAKFVYTANGTPSLDSGAGFQIALRSTVLVCPPHILCSASEVTVRAVSSGCPARFETVAKAPVPERPLNEQTGRVVERRDRFEGSW